MDPGSGAEGEAVSGAQLIAESLKAQVRGWGTGKDLPYGEREGTVAAGHAARGAPGPRVPAGSRGAGEQRVCAAGLTLGSAADLPAAGTAGGQGSPCRREGGPAAAARTPEFLCRRGQA